MSKKKTTTKPDAVIPPAPVEPAQEPIAAAASAEPLVEIAPSGTKVPGVLDSQLHPSLHEAHRVLQVGRDAFAKVLDQVEGQFVRPLLNAHDGDADACLEIKRQIAAFRGIYR